MQEPYDISLQLVDTLITTAVNKFYDLSQCLPQNCCSRESVFGTDLLKWLDYYDDFVTSSNINFVNNETD